MSKEKNLNGNINTTNDRIPTMRSFKNMGYSPFFKPHTSIHNQTQTQTEAAQFKNQKLQFLNHLNQNDDSTHHLSKSLPLTKAKHKVQNVTLFKGKGEQLTLHQLPSRIKMRKRVSRPHQNKGNYLSKSVDLRKGKVRKSNFTNKAYEAMRGQKKKKPRYKQGFFYTSGRFQQNNAWSDTKAGPKSSLYRRLSKKISPKTIVNPFTPKIVQDTQELQRSVGLVKQQISQMGQDIEERLKQIYGIGD